MENEKQLEEQEETSLKYNQDIEDLKKEILDMNDGIFREADDINEIDTLLAEEKTKQMSYQSEITQYEKQLEKQQKKESKKPPPKSRQNRTKMRSSLNELS